MLNDVKAARFRYTKCLKWNKRAKDVAGHPTQDQIVIDKWQRKVPILELAVEEVARIALFIQGEGLPKTAKESNGSLRIYSFSFHLL